MKSAECVLARFSICLAPLALLQLASAAPAPMFTAAPGSPFPAPFTATAGFVAASFNDEGRSDLVGVNTTTNMVEVLLSDGKGRFTSPLGKPYAVATGSTLLTAGDFNHDGRTDLVVLDNTTLTLTILLGSDGGGVRVAPGSPFKLTALYPGVATIGDFNGDGKLDIAIANNTVPVVPEAYAYPGHGPASVIVLLGNGAGEFHPAPGSPFIAAVPGPSTMGVTALAAGDFNRDGVEDLVVGYYNDVYYPLLVMQGSRSGSLTAMGSLPVLVTGTLGGTNGIVVADFNCDGIPDVAISETSFSHGGVEVRLGDGKGGFKQYWNAGLLGQPRGLSVADFNGDGRPDVAFNQFTADVGVYLGDGTGTHFGPSLTAGYQQPDYYYSLDGEPIGSQLVTGDFNADGKPDLLLTDFQTAAVLLNALPAITASPATLTFYSAMGVSVAPNGNRVRVDSTLPGSTWTATFNQPWLAATPASSATGGPATATISITHPPARGVYSGVVRYTAPGFFGAETVVKLDVVE